MIFRNESERATQQLWVVSPTGLISVARLKIIIMASKISLIRGCCLGLLLVAGCRAQTLAVSDSDLLNFALNLECLEAEYYSTAINGYGLNSTTLGSGGGPAVGGLKANLSPELIQIATELANDEINHVRPSLTSLRQLVDKGAHKGMPGDWLRPSV